MSSKFNNVDAKFLTRQHWLNRVTGSQRTPMIQFIRKIVEYHSL